MKKIYGTLFFMGIFFFPTSLQTEILTHSEEKDLIKRIYKNINGFSIDPQESTKISEAGGNSTYGEITDEGVLQLIKELNPTKDDVFYDLGSGAGRMVITMHLISPVKKTLGIELASSRHEKAMQALKDIKKEIKVHPLRIIDFKNEDLLKFPLHDATIIYTASTCFSDKFMEKLTKKLAQELPKGAKVLTLRQLAQDSAFNLKKQLQVPMTWSNNVTVYVYEKVS